MLDRLATTVHDSRTHDKRTLTVHLGDPATPAHTRAVRTNVPAGPRHVLARSRPAAWWCDGVEPGHGLTASH
jgi:hypothetical protein